MNAGDCGDEYLMLKDVRICLNMDGIFGDEGFAGFSLCLWIYLSSSPMPSSVILRQVLFDHTTPEPNFPFPYFGWLMGFLFLRSFGATLVVLLFVGDYVHWIVLLTSFEIRNSAHFFIFRWLEWLNTASVDGCGLYHRRKSPCLLLSLLTIINIFNRFS